jgi:glycosyltransferase involved in cell wall biosynthesis
MRILALVTDAYGGRGGIAKYNRDLLQALCESSMDNEVIAFPRLAPDPVGELPRGLDYELSGMGSKWRYTVSVLRCAYRKRCLDLIVCGHIHLLPVAFLARSIIPRAPIVLVVHGIDAWRSTGKRLVDRLAGRVDAVVSVSELTRRRFLSWAIGAQTTRSFIIPNTVDADRFQPGAPRDDLVRRYQLEGKSVLLTLGRLSASERYKGVDLVLELMPRLLQERPNLVYMVAGDGTDRERLQAKARQLGVAAYVVFTGYVPEEEKADYYRLADAYVMPSHGEGFGIVFLEAMACGIPVVGSAVDGGREALRDGQLGILVDPARPAEVMAGILSALGKDKGRPPAGLDYFSYEHFSRRVRQVMNMPRFVIPESPSGAK